MTGRILRRGATLTLGGVAIAIAIPLIAHGLQNPRAQWRNLVQVVDDIVVPLASAEKVGPGWAVQVGAYAQAESARGQLALLAQRQPDLLAAAMPIVEPVDIPGGKRLFRARFGTFSRQDADALCVRLRARGLSCIIMAQAAISLAPVSPAPVALAPASQPAIPQGRVLQSSISQPAAVKPATTAVSPPPATQPVHVARAAHVQALDDSALADMRGGFFLAGGAQFDFGASVRTMVNGQLALQSTVQWTQSGPMVRQAAGPGTTPIPPVQLAQLFGGNTGAQMGVTVPASSGSTAVLANVATGQIQNVLLNTASNQTVSQNTDVLLTIYNLPQLQQQISQQLLSARLANDVMAANMAR